MMDSPFVSKTFTDIWLESFRKNAPPISVVGIQGTSFVQEGRGWLVNLGHTHTKGLCYELEDSVVLNGRTCLVYDVPSYFNCPKKVAAQGVKLKKVRQYPGYLIALDQYGSMQDFMQHRFKKSSRYKLNKYFKRLTSCFDIKTVMYRGEMDEGEFNEIFQKFRILLEVRFQEKGEYNNNLDAEEWDFYKKVALPMIQKKEAGLFVVYDGKEPVAITLNYFSDNVIFDAITVFDTDYAKFHLGSVNIMFLIQWGLENGFKILDFSKGHFDYKVRWATQRYDFEYHILYDPESILSTSRAFLKANFFQIKQHLRDLQLNLVMNRIKFFLKGKESATKQGATARKFTFKDFEMDNNSAHYRVDGYGPEIKKMFLEYLYLYGETAKEVVVSKFKDQGELYVFEGKKNKIIGTLT